MFVKQGVHSLSTLLISTRKRLTLAHSVQVCTRKKVLGCCLWIFKHTVVFINVSAVWYFRWCYQCSAQGLATMMQAASSQAPSQHQVYLDVSVDGELKGRLVIQLSEDAPVGTKRFSQLSQGLNGVGYRLSKFDGIAQVVAAQHTLA